MSPVDDLPVELIDSIFNCLPQDRNLSNASAVCRAWASALRPRIFETLNITPKNARLLAKLVSSPLCTIPRRVRTLSFCVPRIWIQVYAGRLFSSFEEIMRYFQPEAVSLMTLYVIANKQSKTNVLTSLVLHKLIRTLPEELLLKLKLLSEPISRRTVLQFNGVSATFFSTLHSLELVNVSFDSLGDMLFMVKTLPSLRSLSLVSIVFIAPPSPETEDDVEFLGRLHTLKVAEVMGKHTGVIFPLLLKCGSLSIESLSITEDYGMLSHQLDIQPLLDRLGTESKLQHLEISFTYVGPAPICELDLSQCTSLRSLSLNFEDTQDIGAGWPANYFHPILTLPPTTTQTLETFNLRMKFNLYTRARPIYLNRIKEDLSAVDHVLFSRAKLRALFVSWIILPKLWSDEHPTLEVASAMPLARERGILTVMNSEEGDN